MPVHVSYSADTADQPAPVSPTSTEGWGEVENELQEEHENDKDGWDDVEPLEEPKPSPALTNIQAAQKWPVSQPKTQGNNIQSTSWCGGFTNPSFNQTSDIPSSCLSTLTMVPYSLLGSPIQNYRYSIKFIITDKGHKHIYKKTISLLL
ncbi:hypothetical protein CsSME_00028860 [Camellia sinensis var. sinensis]